MSATTHEFHEGPAPGGFALEGEPTRPGALLVSLWRSRALVRMLSRTEFFVRYRRALLGLAWAVALPLVQAVVIAAVVSRFVRFRLEVPYIVFVFAGLVMWGFFSGSVAAGSTAIADGSQLSTKIYFPRAVLALVKVGANLYGLALSIGVLLVIALVAGVGIGPWVVLLLPALVLGAALAAAFSLVLSAVHVYFRDTRYLVAAALLAWFYATPVFYPLAATGGLRPVIEANPMTAPIELLRAALVGWHADLVGPLLWSLGWVAALFVVALVLHSRFDRVFADRL